MNFFCRIFGHTWVYQTRAPRTRWNVGKTGHTLVGTHDEEPVAHLRICRRCGLVQDVGARPHDRDGREAPAAAATGG
jgi:hypothetical protein